MVIHYPTKTPKTSARHLPSSASNPPQFFVSRFLSRSAPEVGTESQEGILSSVPFATSELLGTGFESDRMHLQRDSCSQHLSTHLPRTRVEWHQIPLDPLSMGPGGLDGMDGMADMAGGNPGGGNPAGGKPVGGNPLGGKPGMSPAHPRNGT